MVASALSSAIAWSACTPASESLADARRSLRELGASLVSFLDGSEAIFLSTGSQLQDLVEQSTRLIGAGSRDAALEGPGASPVTRLGYALERMEQQLGESREAATNAVAGLTKVRQCLERLPHADTFSTISSALRAFATTLRIEDCRHVNGAGFAVVAADVRRSGELISAKFDAILARSRSLQDTVGRAYNREQQFLHEQGASSSALLAETRRSLAALSALDALASAARARASAAADELSGAVGRILVQLQVHDITRQMIQHVVEALGAASASGAGATPEQELAELSALCTLQAQQLGSARAQLVDAHGSIASSLRTMAEQVARVAEGEQAGSEDRRLLQSAERGIRQVANIQKVQLEHEQETLNAVALAVEASAGMEVFVGEIAAMAHDVKVVALNALISATKTGGNGAVFSLLAKSIKDLSAEVTQQAGTVGQLMRDAVTVAQALRQVRLENRMQEAARIAAELSELTTRLRNYHEALLDNVATLRRGGARLASEVEQAAHGFAEQAKVAERLRDTEDTLSALARHMAMLAGPVAHDADSTHFSAAAARYTMAAEREIHSRAASADARASPGAPICAAEPTGDLGANVELF